MPPLQGLGIHELLDPGVARLRRLPLAILFHACGVKSRYRTGSGSDRIIEATWVARLRRLPLAITFHACGVKSRYRTGSDSDRIIESTLVARPCPFPFA